MGPDERHPGRGTPGGGWRRALRALAALTAVLGALAAVNAAFGQQSADEQSDLAERGANLWGRQCATCHGELLRGIEGKGPDIRDVGPAAIDFVVRTGRMPLPSANAQMRRRPPQLSDEQRRALVAYYQGRFPEQGPAIPEIDAASGDLARGRELFTQNCAACHGATGAGIAVGQNDVAPALDAATPVEIAEAVRTGPGRMPVFGTEVYTEEDLESVTAWVLDLRRRAAPGGAQIGRSGPVFEGAVAWILGIGTLLVVIYLLGERPRGNGARGGDDDDGG